MEYPKDPESPGFLPPPLSSLQEPPEYDIPPLKPNNWLWQSIVATILCCMPFGVAGIIYAVKVDSFYYAGRYADAERMSQKARMWTLISAAIALVYCIIWTSMLLTGNLPEYMENIIERGASGYNF